MMPHVAACVQAFLEIDEVLLNEEALKDEMGGSTAVCCLIKDKKLYCANAGDSRAIACINGEVHRIVLMFDCSGMQCSMFNYVSQLLLFFGRPLHFLWTTSPCCRTKCNGSTIAAVGWRTAVSMAAWPCRVHWAISNSSRTRKSRPNVK